MTIRVDGQPEVIWLGPDVANKMLTEYKYPKQRGVNFRRVDQYARDIRNDDFLPGTVIKLAALDGATYLINGQHRLEAIVGSGIPVFMVVIRMAVDTKQELGKLYYEEDMGLPRTIGQMFRSMEVGDTLGVPEYLARRAGHAVNFIKSGWVHTKVTGLTKDEILRYLVDDYAKALSDYRNATMVKIGGIYSSMWRSPVCAVGIEIFRFANMPDASPELHAKAHDFWHGLVLDDGLRMGDPRKVAREHILSTTLGDEKISQKVTRGYQARYIAACWNAFYEGKNLNIQSRSGPVRIMDQNGPIALLGTTWDGTHSK